jgi:hypothetical protein
MAASDLIWLIAPDGYVGFSVGTEIAYAAGRGVPVYTADTIAEPAIAALARRAMTITEAMQRAHGTPHKTQAAQSMLFDPESASHHAQEALGALRELLLYPKRGQLFTAALASTVRSAVSGL